MVGHLKTQLKRKQVLCRKISTSYLKATLILNDTSEEMEKIGFLQKDSSIEDDLEMRMEMLHTYVRESTRIQKNANESSGVFLSLAEKYRRYSRNAFPTLLLSEKELRNEFIRARVVSTLAKSKPEGTIFPIHDLYQ